MQIKIVSVKKIGLFIKAAAPKSLLGTMFLVLAFSSLTAITPQKVQAAQGNNALLLIGEKCHDLEDNAHDFGVQDPEGNSRCDGSSLHGGWNGNVNRHLGCNVGFYQDTLQDGTVLWYTQGNSYATCVKNAKAQLNRKKAQCDGVKRDTEKGRICNENAKNLNAALGCDLDTTDKVDAVLQNNQAAISSCEAQINKAAEAKLYHVVDGVSVQKAEAAVAAADLADVGTGEDSASTDDANCEGGGALGWIICPVSELIANFTTDMFQDVIAPMLENVPISTQRTGPDSGGFQAWQSMRVIANALLVVSLLAVVYSQAKGGD